MTCRARPNLSLAVLPQAPELVASTCSHLWHLLAASMCSTASSHSSTHMGMQRGALARIGTQLDRSRPPSMRLRTAPHRQGVTSPLPSMGMIDGNGYCMPVCMCRHATHQSWPEGTVLMCPAAALSGPPSTAASAPTYIRKVLHSLGFQASLLPATSAACSAASPSARCGACSDRPPQLRLPHVETRPLDSQCLATSSPTYIALPN